MMTTTRLNEPWSLDEWREVPERNVIARKLAQMRSHADRVLSGAMPAMFVAGGSGMGKNHVVETAIKASGLGAAYTTPRQPHDLLHAFHDATHGRNSNPKVIVLDEADLIFRSVACLNIMKMATDVTGRRHHADYQFTVEREIEGADGESITKRTKGKGVSLTCPIIAMTNRDLDEVRDATAAHTDALFSRVPPIFIPDDRLAAWEYVIWLTLSTDLITRHRGDGVSIDDREYAVEWFTRHIWNLKQASVRTMLKVIEAVRNSDDDDGDPTADLELLCKPRSEWVVRPVPQLLDWRSNRMALTRSTGLLPI